MRPPSKASSSVWTNLLQEHGQAMCPYCRTTVFKAYLFSTRMRTARPWTIVSETRHLNSTITFPWKKKVSSINKRCPPRCCRVDGKIQSCTSWAFGLPSIQACLALQMVQDRRSLSTSMGPTISVWPGAISSSGNSWVSLVSMLKGWVSSANIWSLPFKDLAPWIWVTFQGWDEGELYRRYLRITVL